MAGQFWTLTHYFPLEIVMLALCIAYNCALFSIKSVPKLLTFTLQGVTTNKLQCEHLQVSSGLIFTDWDEGTLDHASCYTTESDIYQIGVMLLKLPSLSPAGVAFGHKLKTKTVTAAEAAQDKYL